ncbi:flavodoxin [uncultured Faecalibaculum sp.]|uniref:flavodoxin n=1 Tax=uncultured Faecalibaculum sp. TaxID=1729681 RepID=UPI00261DC738|nr:hypothetical protein [uncultured Faecalibaculum sp.]
MKICRILLCALTMLLGFATGCTSADSSDSKPVTLVVYYTGGDDRIRDLAQEAAKAAQCHMFEIQPEKDYSSLLEKLNSTEELTAEELESLYADDFRLKQPIPENWKNYDRILLGTPLWLDGAPVPVRLFLDQNNLEGKQFFPFTIGTSKQAAGLSTELSLDGWRKEFQEGKGFNSDADSTTVTQWVNSLRTDQVEE